MQKIVSWVNNKLKPKKLAPSLVSNNEVLSSINYANVHSYAQEGEDLILAEIIGYKESGFYIDIGAHHPFRFSNTQKFYEWGWRGINIDPIPGMEELFNAYRPEDVNLQLGVGENNSSLKYYVMDESALNSFDESRVKHLIENTPYRLVSTIDVKLVSLKEVFEIYAKDKIVDFLSIDAETFELKVLKGNDWSIYRPKYILIELLDLNLNDLSSNEVHNFLISKSYALIAKTLRTAYYESN